MSSERKFEFSLERTAFAMALQRLGAPGSDLAGSAWVKTTEAPGFGDLALQHFYRTAAFLTEVRLGENRYVVCRNPLEAKKDAVQRDARLDGKFVLRTNTNLWAAEVAQTYKSLRRVARTFREQRSTLAVRPICHYRDDTAIGHIVASFVALRLEVDLQQRLDERQADVSWPDLMRDLGQVQSVLLELDGNRYQVRTDMAGSAHHAFATPGVRPPSPVTYLGPLS